MQFNLIGELLHRYEDVISASQETNIAVEAIRNTAVKRCKNAGRYIWIFEDQYIGIDSLEWYLENQWDKVIEQYTLDGKFIRYWDSGIQVQTELKIDPVGCCDHYALSAGGYIWKYFGDPLVIDNNYCEWVKDKHKHGGAVVGEETARVKPFYQIDQNGDFVKLYISLHEAGKDGFSYSMISQCLRNLRSVYKGYAWVYQRDICNLTLEDILNKFQVKTKLIRGKKIYQKDLQGNIVNVFDNLKQCENEGFARSCVSNCCRGLSQTYRGYIWEYDKD